MISRSPLSRSTVIAALSTAFAVGPIQAQRPAPAQRGGAPRSDTPQLVVSVLASRDPSVGVAAADAIRRRIQSEHTATDLYVVPRPTIEQTLRASGYNPDSALGPTEVMALTKQVRGDYALAGTVERAGSEVRTSVTLLTQNGAFIVAEPLGPIVGSDLGDVAKQVDRAVSEALRALTFNQECRKAVAMGDYRQARVAAQQGLRLRPMSAALNLCLLSTLTATRAPTDSIIAVASLVTTTDSENIRAWIVLADAHREKADTARAIDATRMVHHLDPSDVGFTLRYVDLLVSTNQSERALAVLDSALSLAPTNPDVLRKRWLLHLRLGRLAEALVSGAALIAADSAAATADYYERQLGAAEKIHDSVATRQIARDAAARFPRNVNFALLLARDAVNRTPREAIDLAERALAVEPTNAAAWKIAITAQARANPADSAIATARRALSAGVAVDAVGSSLLAVVNGPLVDAQNAPTRARWEAVLRAAQRVDSTATSTGSSFYVGFAAFQVANYDIQSLAEFAKLKTSTRAQRQSACTAATTADDLLKTASVFLTKGGGADAATAAKLLMALTSYSEFVTSAKQAACRQRDDDGPT